MPNIDFPNRDSAAPFDFGIFPLLETDRLCLREITVADADALFALRGDYAVTRLNIGDAYTTVEEAYHLIGEIRICYVERREIRWGITSKEEGDTLIGMIGYNYWKRADRRASLGFDLRQSHWRRGIMTEAATAVLDFGFGAAMHLNRIEADTSAENVASNALLQKLGFVCEGRQREQYFHETTVHDLLLWGILRREWKR